MYHILCTVFLELATIMLGCALWASICSPVADVAPFAWAASTALNVHTEAGYMHYPVFWKAIPLGKHVVNASQIPVKGGLCHSHKYATRPMGLQLKEGRMGASWLRSSGIASSVKWPLSGRHFSQRSWRRNIRRHCLCQGPRIPMS